MLKNNKEAMMCCPNCGSKYKQKMPLIGKHINNQCVFCHTFFGITNSDDCCVYCKYSNVLCPKAQKNIEIK